jgi:formamidopyrimidine-DNA glycosylase
MPELAEIRGFAAAVNACAGFSFVSCRKSDVHRGTAVELPPHWTGFRVSARARGKEMILTMANEQDPNDCVFVRFGFGMTGKMKYYPASKEVAKHAHFIMECKDGGNLCFVDQRRFGTWTVVDRADAWGPDRGPCPVEEFEAFARHVASTIRTTKWWNKPICETLLDQSLFNGIGNYLRAEILHDAGVTDPFQKTSAVFADLTVENCLHNRVLQLCKVMRCVV